MEKIGMKNPSLKKNRITRIFACFLVLVLSVTLTGCVGANRKESKKIDTSKEQRYAYPLATASPEDTVTQIYAEKFAEEVKKLSHGRIKIQVYPNSVLGGDRELLESCYDGDIPFVVQNTAPQVNFIPDTAVFDSPCVFDDLEEVRTKVDDKTFLSDMQKSYRKAGYELLGYADQGFRVMSTNRKVTSFADFKGQKIRTMENRYHLNFWKCLGANPTPMNFSEVYIGLQQKTIDAQENPCEVIVSNRLYEQQDYVVETNQLPHLISLIVSEKFYQQFDEKDQKIIRQAEENAKVYARAAADERNEEKIKEIKKSGTQILTLNEKTRTEMKQASAGVREAIRKKVLKKIADAYMGEE